jgi:hypothetical protein
VLHHDDHQLSMDAIDVYLISIRRQHENDMQLSCDQRYLWKLRQAIHISRRDVITATSADEHYTTTIAFTKT